MTDSHFDRNGSLTEPNDKIRQLSHDNFCADDAVSFFARQNFGQDDNCGDCTA